MSELYYEADYVMDPKPATRGWYCRLCGCRNDAGTDVCTTCGQGRGGHRRQEPSYDPSETLYMPRRGPAMADAGTSPKPFVDSPAPRGHEIPQPASDQASMHRQGASPSHMGSAVAGYRPSQGVPMPASAQGRPPDDSAVLQAVEEPEQPEPASGTGTGAGRRDRKERRRSKKLFMRARRKLTGNPYMAEREVEPPVEYVRDPKGPQRVVPFEMLFRDGMMRLADGRWSVAVLFEDVNYTMIRQEDQADIILAYRKFLNSLDDVSMQVVLTASAIDKRTFASDFAMAPNPYDRVGNEYRREFNEYIQSKLSSSARSMRHDRCLVFTCEAATHDEAARTLAGTIGRCTKFMRLLGADVRAMSGQDRMDQICLITHPGDPRGKYTFDRLSSTPGLLARDLCSPWSVFRPGDGRDDSRLVVGGRWVKSYTILADGWGNSVRDDFLTDLTGLTHDIRVSLHVRPWDREEAKRMVEDHLFDITDENVSWRISKSRPEKGYFVDEENMPRSMRNAEEGARATAEAIENQDQRLFAVTMVVTVTADSEAGLDEACKDVEAVFQAQSKPGAESWVTLREQCFASSLPIGVCEVPYQRNITTWPLSGMVPFDAVQFQDPHGMLMGVDQDTRNILVYDRASRTHTNAFVVGMPGGGKSVIVKLMQLQVRLRYPDDDQITLDPEGEYLAITEALGGQNINISETSKDHVNPLGISPYYGSIDPDKQTNPLPNKVSFVQALIHMMTRSVTDEQKNVIDSACSAIYGRWLQTHNPADIPTLTDLYNYLQSVEGQMEPAARQLALLIQRYVTGTFSVFNHQTNVDVDNRMVNYVLVDMSAELKPLAMLILLDSIWVRVTRNRREGRRTWLWVDEMNLILDGDDELAIREFDRYWRRGRKWDLYNTAITQNIESLSDRQLTSYMLRNTPLVVMTKQSGESADDIGELYSMSSDQVAALRSMPPGEGFAMVGNKMMHYDFTIDRERCPQIYRLITTKPDDLREERRSTAVDVDAEIIAESATDVAPFSDGRDTPGERALTEGAGTQEQSGGAEGTETDDAEDAVEPVFMTSGDIDDEGEAETGPEGDSEDGAHPAFIEDEADSPGDYDDACDDGKGATSVVSCTQEDLASIIDAVVQSALDARLSALEGRIDKATAKAEPGHDETGSEAGAPDEGHARQALRWVTPGDRGVDMLPAEDADGAGAGDGDGATSADVSKDAGTRPRRRFSVREAAAMASETKRG